MSSTRCLSSLLTTELLQIRNPLGGERNWPNHAGLRIGSYPGYHKVIAAEIGLAILCVTAAIESIAYTILTIGSVPLLLVSDRALNWSTRLLSSSSFTIFWNIGNLTTFNLFYNNIFTDESFARFCMDHMIEGDLCKTVLKVALLAGIFVINLFSKTAIASHNIARCINSLDSLNITFFRPEDRFHIIQRYGHRAYLRLIEEVGIPALQLQLFPQNIDQSINEGTDFFGEYFLNSEEMGGPIKAQIREYDADIFVFVLTRSVFIYTLGSKREYPIPSFFKPSTNVLIESFRDKYRNNYDQIRENLKPLMQDLELFNGGLPSNQTPQDDSLPIRVAFNDLREAAHAELQNSLFLTQCWSRACSMQEEKEASR